MDILRYTSNCTYKADAAAVNKVANNGYKGKLREADEGRTDARGNFYLHLLLAIFMQLV
jgi:hypothetical protein